MTDSTIVHRNFEAARQRVAALPFPDPDLPLAVNMRPRPRRPLPVKPASRPLIAPVIEAAAHIAAGRLTSEQTVHQAIAAARDAADLGAVVYMDEEMALAAARLCDARAKAGDALGPLHGVPITVKDVVHVAGMPTRAGSAAYHALPSEDAASVARLRAAGAFVLAKVATHEFALGVTTPQARNPWDPTRIPGGSSGGSAIALVKGIGHLSVGTDTRASIRVPSALSGVVGFKPTFGAVDTRGIVTLSWSMDHAAPMAANAGDAAVAMDLLLEEPLGLPHYLGADIRGLRLGVPEAAFEGADSYVGTSVKNAVDRLAASGVEVVPLERPSRDDFDLANLAGLITGRCEAALYHRAIGTDLSRCWDETREQLEEAARIPALEYLAAQRARARMMEEMLDVMDGVDALAMPTSLAPAPRVEEAEQFIMTLARNCILWSFVGFPAMSVPCRDVPGVLPVGLQLVAAPRHEPVLVALASAYERAR